ncbi:hypothetical protein HDV06_004490 [Boothiomyces sp. JEL0866]|nr:hypothetical protein HDV06_004490 [Boothiomyces sp. JEL0866]
MHSQERIITLTTAVVAPIVSGIYYLGLLNAANSVPFTFFSVKLGLLGCYLFLVAPLISCLCSVLVLTLNRELFYGTAWDGFTILSSVSSLFFILASSQILSNSIGVLIFATMDLIATVSAPLFNPKLPANITNMNVNHMAVRTMKTDILNSNTMKTESMTNGATHVGSISLSELKSENMIASNMHTDNLHLASLTPDLVNVSNLTPSTMQVQHMNPATMVVSNLPV